MARIKKVTFEEYVDGIEISNWVFPDEYVVLLKSKYYAVLLAHEIIRDHPKINVIDADEGIIEDGGQKYKIVDWKRNPTFRVEVEETERGFEPTKAYLSIWK